MMCLKTTNGTKGREKVPLKAKIIATICSIVGLFFSNFFTFVNEKEVYPSLFEFVKSIFCEESTTNTTTTIPVQTTTEEDTTFQPANTETTLLPTTTEAPTNNTKPFTEKGNNHSDITKTFTTKDTVESYYIPKISGEYWFAFDISTVKSKFDITVYNQKDEIIEEASSSKDGMLVYLNENERYQIIINTDTDNYPFTAYITIYEPNVTQIIELS